MARFVDEGAEGQVQDTKIGLKEHLSKHNVSDAVYALLQQENITIDELITFTVEDLKDWCNEHKLKIIERRRFLNAIKSLPNAQSNIQVSEPKIVEVPIFLGNEEKEQLNQFDDMKNNVENMIKCVTEIKTKMNVDNVIEEINKVCDKIESFVETLRKNLLKQVYVLIFVHMCVLSS